MVLARILGASWSSFGTLLIGVGALLIALDTLYPPSAWGRTSYFGTYPMPRGRFALGAAIVGVVLAATGSVIVALDSDELSVLAIVVVLVAVIALIWVVMAVLLWRHLDFAWYGERAPDKHSFWWCLWHPLWTNDAATGTDEANEYLRVKTRKWRALTDEAAEKVREIEAKLAETKQEQREAKRAKREVKRARRTKNAKRS